MSPKVMASFSAFGGDLLSIAFIVLHSLEGSVLWSSVSTNCLHVFLRCSFIVLVISSFICCRVGEVGSLDLRSSRALIFSNISAGTGSVLIRCRPEGICRDAAFRMMVRKIFSPFWQFDGRPYWRQPHAWNAVSNSPKYGILSETQLIQLYKFVCTIPTQNNNINLHSKPPFSCILRHTWVKAVELFYPPPMRRPRFHSLLLDQFNSVFTKPNPDMIVTNPFSFFSYAIIYERR